MHRLRHRSANSKQTMGHIPNSVTPRTFEISGQDRKSKNALCSIVSYVSGNTLQRTAVVRAWHCPLSRWQLSRPPRLVNKHLEWYANVSLPTLIRGSTLYVCRGGNKDIVRILFMVPIYAIASVGSYVFWVCLSLSLYL